MSSSSSLGDLFLLRGGSLPCFRSYASRSLPSVIRASSGCVCDLRKCVHPINLASSLCFSILERIQDALLPMYRTISLLALPISYTPACPCGKARIFSILKRIHFVLSGITHLSARFRSFYTKLAIDSNRLSMLTLAKKLGGLAWAGAIETTLTGYSMLWGTG